jgi:hypothetical protein
MRVQRLFSVVLAVGALATAAPAAQACAPSPWQPYRTSPFVDEAGTTCAFEVKGDIVVDQERIRTLATGPNGAPTEQEITGPLTIRFTNTANGASVTRDLAGTGWLYYHSDGTQTWVVSGHISLGIHVGNPYESPGEWVYDGRTVLETHPGVGPQVLSHQGATENLCTVLG